MSRSKSASENGSKQTPCRISAVRILNEPVFTNQDSGAGTSRPRSPHRAALQSALVLRQYETTPLPSPGSGQLLGAKRWAEWMPIFAAILRHLHWQEDAIPSSPRRPSEYLRLR